MVVILEFEFVDLPGDGKWNDVTWTRLLTGLSEVDVSGGEPDFVAQLVLMSGGRMGFRLVLVPPNCPFEMYMC